MINRRQFNERLLLAAPGIALWRTELTPQSTSVVRVNGTRLNTHLTELAQFGRTPEGGTHRVAYSDPDLHARE